jgi:hypothetical protein
MTMTTTMTEIREIDRDEMAGVDGGFPGDDHQGIKVSILPRLIPPGWWPYPYPFPSPDPMPKPM